MTDKWGQVRPDDETYLADIERLRGKIQIGRPIYLEHAEFATGKKLLLLPGQAVEPFAEPFGPIPFRPGKLSVFYLGHTGPVSVDLDGMDWVHYTYAAEKFGIEKYPGDAVSLANFINRLLGWGDDKMQVAG